MAEGFLNSLRDMLAGFQGKPTGSTLPLVRSQGNEPINFGYWTPRWEQLWHRARNAIDRSGGRELQPVLDALGDKWAALKQAETDRVASATRGPVDSATDSMEPIDRAPEPRFRIKRSQRLVLIDGNARSLSEQLLKLLCLLATNAQLGDRFVPNKEIEELLWGTNLHRIARPVADVVRELRDALAGKNGDRGEIRKLIQTQPRVGTRLALAPKEIAIEE